MKATHILAIIGIVAALAAGCISSGSQAPAESLTCSTVAECYAEELGYHCETRTGDYGDYLAVVFSDGSSCDAWEFYWGRCGESWQTEYLREFIEIQVIRGWPNEITVSGYMRTVAKNAAQKGYYVTEKDSHLDTLEIRSSSGEIVREIRVFINDAWKEDLTSALASCN